MMFFRKIRKHYFTQEMLDEKNELAPGIYMTCNPFVEEDKPVRCSCKIINRINKTYCSFIADNLKHALSIAEDYKKMFQEIDKHGEIEIVPPLCIYENK